MTHPEEIVQRQLEAYNAQDLEAYVATFSPAIELFELPGTEPVLSGQVALRQHYAERFRRHPRLRGEVTERMLFGDYVIYHEQLYGLEPDEVVSLIAIYQVEAGLIRRLWFIR